MYCYKSSKIGLHVQCQRKECLVDIQSETVFDKLLCKNKGLFTPLTVSDDHLTVGGKWQNVDFSFLFIPIKPFPFPFP